MSTPYRNKYAEDINDIGFNNIHSSQLYNNVSSASNLPAEVLNLKLLSPDYYVNKVSTFANVQGIEERERMKEARKLNFISTNDTDQSECNKVKHRRPLTPPCKAGEQSSFVTRFTFCVPPFPCLLTIEYHLCREADANR